MKKILIFSSFVLLFLSFSSCNSVDKEQKDLYFKKAINNWYIQNSDSVNAKGDELSSPNYQIKNWYKAEVPATVLHTLVQNGIYKDIYLDNNLEKIPSEQFKSAWWYRTTFSLDMIPESLLLNLEGINYKANIWLNGKPVADTTDVINAYRKFKFDIKKYVTQGKNTLAIEVFPPRNGDFSIGFVDWNPAPPDRNMGIFRKVFLEANHGVAVSQPFITSSLNTDLSKAKLQASVLVTNYSNKPLSGNVNFSFDKTHLTKKIDLKAGEYKKVIFNSADFSQLNIEDPKLWWPHTLGDPYLYKATFTFSKDDKIYDKKEIKYGIRTLSKYYTQNGARGYKINGKKLLIRGGGWTDKLLLEDTKESIEAQLDYVKDMNLNTIRMEGFWGKDQTIYNLCDEKGILIMVGFSCQWEWPNLLGKTTDPKYGGIISKEDIDLISKAWKDQIVYLRNHPSIFSWVAGSDLEPKPELERKYFEILKNYDSTRIYLASAKKTTTLDGPTGVKMEGPYAYIPPVYWYSDTIKGGAYGFNTETGPGAQVPPLQSLKKMLSPEHLWPIDSMWDYHCGRGKFKNLDRYNKAMNKRYGKPENLNDYLKKAQLLNYELMRPMFEAFSAYRNKNATGVIQWMLNSAWPEMYWQLYDYYLMPNGAYYAAKVAQRSHHIIYDYHQKALFAVNDRLEDLNGCTVKVRVYDLNSEMKLEKSIKVDLKGNSSKIIHAFDKIDISPMYFIDTRLYNKEGKEIDHNFYWISQKKDLLDYKDKTEAWYVTTHSKQYADFTALNTLPKVEIETQITVNKGDKKTNFEVRIKNKSDKIAFFIHTALVDSKTGEAILPVIWSDNYISLLPHEERLLSVKINNNLLKGIKPRLLTDAYNLKKKMENK